MTTTIMKDSVVGDQWITEMTMANQPSRIIDPNTGQWNGNLRCFARLAFTEPLFVAQPKMKSDPNSRVGFGCVLLFPPMTKFDVLWEEYNRICQSDFQNLWNGQGYAVTNPLRNCAEKPQFAGYTPGCLFTTVGSDFKPPITDTNYNPIVDPSRAHSGVWAIAAINAYASGKGKPNKGPRFGLQTLMIVADDTNLAGAPPDPRQQFAGVSVRPPTVQPNAHFGTNVATPPQGGGVGAFYPPGAPGAPSMGAPPAYGAPAAPQGYAPQPPQPGYPPGTLAQPQHPAQPAYDPALAQFMGR